MHKNDQLEASSLSTLKIDSPPLTEPEIKGADMFDGASGPTRLSDTIPTRLIQSTGNLYWSSNPLIIFSGPEKRDNVPTIFRASKSSQPGEEVALYTEPGAGEFGALTFAKVGDEFYGYFVANYTDRSQIKRIPLGAVTLPGDALVLSPSPPSGQLPPTIGQGDLVTDGSFLCWADSEGIKSMPIGGGNVTTLVKGSGFERLAGLGGTLYYIDGDTIWSVPMGGGSPSFVLGTRLFPITALDVLAVPPPFALAERPETPRPPIVSEVAVVWGRSDGGVFGMVRGQVTTYQEPGAEFTVSSVYSTEGRVLWFQQASPGEGAAAGAPQVLMSYQGVTTTLSSNSEDAPIFGRLDVLADEVAAYWTWGYVQKNTF
jgi:hypothetical protein